MTRRTPGNRIRSGSLGFGLLLVVVGAAGLLDGLFEVRLAQVASVGLLVAGAVFLGVVTWNRRQLTEQNVTENALVGDLEREESPSEVS